MRSNATEICSHSIFSWGTHKVHLRVRTCDFCSLFWWNQVTGSKKGWYSTPNTVQEQCGTNYAVSCEIAIIKVKLCGPRKCLRGAFLCEQCELACEKECEQTSAKILVCCIHALFVIPFDYIQNKSYLHFHGTASIIVYSPFRTRRHFRISFTSKDCCYQNSIIQEGDQVKSF